MLKACIDSNIWISGVLFDGPPSKVVTAAINKKFDLILSQVILQEVERNLLGKFGFSQTGTKRLLRRMIESADLFEPRGEIRIIPNHHTDNLVLETAILGRAKHLVTGDREHLLPLRSYRLVKIVDAPTFLGNLKS